MLVAAQRTRRSAHVDHYRPTALATEWEGPVLERTGPNRVTEALRAARGYYASLCFTFEVRTTWPVEASR
jgi:hypothetical protein